jgi:hypothetical protein
MCKSWVRIPPPSPHKVKTAQGEGLKTMPEGIKNFSIKVGFCGLNETVEADLADSMRPRYP